MHRYPPTIISVTPESLEKAIQKFCMTNYQTEEENGDHEEGSYSHYKDRIPMLLDALTPKERNIVYLTFWEGLNPYEISFRTRIPYKTVMSLYRSSMEKMRSILTGEERMTG